MSAPPVLDAAGVAVLLAMSEPEFLARRSRLMREHGFPRALPGLGRRWSRAAVLDWTLGGLSAAAVAPDAGAAALPAPRSPGGRSMPERDARDALIAEAQAALEARYVGNIVGIAGRRA